jgi:hypothetical protein
VVAVEHPTLELQVLVVLVVEAWVLPQRHQWRVMA